VSFSARRRIFDQTAEQLRGLRLIFEQPNRGRVFVLRRDNAIVGMINLLFTISTAEGGFVMLLEDLVVHDEYRGHGYGSNCCNTPSTSPRRKLSAHHFADRSPGASLPSAFPPFWFSRLLHDADAFAFNAGGRTGGSEFVRICLRPRGCMSICPAAARSQTSLDMRGGALRLFSFAGIQVYLHFTWFIVAALAITQFAGVTLPPFGDCWST